MKKGSLAILFVVGFGFYAFHAAPGVTTGDSGEFATAAHTLSIPHAPSYPLYMVAGKAWTTLMPWGGAAYQTNLFSAFTSALTLVFLALILIRLKTPWGAALGLSAAFGLTRSFWINSLVTEVFSLHILITAVILYITLGLFDALAREDWFRRAALIAFALGLGAGNHHTLVFLVPAVLFFFFYRNPFSWTPKELGLVFVLGLLGFSIYGLLPFRSGQDPYLNWGKPTTVHNLTRTILRKDYGAFQLALGEQPKRSLSTAAAQQGRYFTQTAHEATIPVVLFSLAGMILGWRRNKTLWTGFFLVFALSGPFFYGLSNLPFTSQSLGIMERFLIMPLLILFLGLGELFKIPRAPAAALAGALALVMGAVNVSHAGVFRHYFLVQDYGRSMLRTVPPGGALFLDGGDDAFYSLAYLNGVEGRRPDLKIHDRGGLIFPNPYGDDFRRIPKEAKTKRREKIERAVFSTRPLYYSSMDPKVLPGVPTEIDGFLLRAGNTGKPEMTPALQILRSLYPLKNREFRSRALAAFFPFMRGSYLRQEGRELDALPYLKRAADIGGDVDWLQTNLGYLYANMGYETLQAGKLDAAEKIYRQWRGFDPGHDQPWTNIGVVLEKQGRLEESRQVYEEAMTRFPKAAQPVYNLAVHHWHQQNWPEVIRLFEEVLKRDPSYPNAAGFLAQARVKAGGAR